MGRSIGGPLWITVPKARPRRDIDPRIVGLVAIAVSLAAIALEIVYAVGHFALATFQRLTG